MHDPQKAPRFSSVYLEPAGLKKFRCFRMPVGYKRCRRLGAQRVQAFGETRFCPGCDRLCQFPATAGLKPNEEVRLVA